MDFANSLQYWSTLGVGGVLAFGMFLIYRQDSRANAEHVRSDAERWRGQSEALMQLVKDNSVALTSNTAAITANTLTIQALHRREDQLNEFLQTTGFKNPTFRGDK